MTTVQGAAVSAGLLAAAAVLVLPRRDHRSRGRLRQVSAGSSPIRRPIESPSSRRRGRTLDPAELADHLAAAFRAGLPAARVWLLLAARPGPLADLAAAAAARSELGVGGGRALWESAGAARAVVLPVAAVLDLCERSGAPAADVLDALADGLRAEAAAATEVRIALAAPAATATVMSLLPVAGLGLGALLGVDTVHVLASTSAGHACLLLGALTWAAGRWWIRRLVAGAEHPDDDP